MFEIGDVILAGLYIHVLGQFTEVFCFDRSVMLEVIDKSLDRLMNIAAVLPCLLD